MSKTITLRVSDETHELLSKRAAEKQQSMSAYAGELLNRAAETTDVVQQIEVPPDVVEVVVSTPPDYKVDEFGVRIPELDGTNKKGRCAHCGAIKILKPVPMGATGKTRRYELWCDWCTYRYKREIGK